ncbi:MAG: hypothetical protein KDN19_11240 [Verrucomicrobiae bacterium]|nr:hypothetical protein [Verrucomicrobiae bacterium]
MKTPLHSRFRVSLILAIICLALNSLRPVVAADKPLQVFILAGQSNMQGHAHVSTFGSMALDPKTAPLLKEMQDEDGNATVCERVWISSIGSSEAEKIGKLTAGFGAEARGPKIGPEFTFGITMEKLLPDQPILIIKTAWGGKSLHTDFRPPGAQPYAFSAQQLERFEKQGKGLAQIKAEKAEATGHYYRLMMDHVRKVLADPGKVCPEYDPKAGYELAGFVWFQGWNDMVDSGTYPDRDKPGGYGKYSELMAQFIRDVRKDLSAPKLPFVIGVLGVNGPTKLYGPDQQRYLSTHQGFRDAMAAPAVMPEFQGNVAAVLTENYWDQEVSALRKREQDIKAEEKKLQKEGNLGRDEIRKQVEARYAETFSKSERDLLQNSVSNAEFHYLGSARIMGPIGQAFAEAVAGLMKVRRN